MFFLKKVVQSLVAFNSLYLLKYFGIVTEAKGRELYLTRIENNIVHYFEYRASAWSSLLILASQAEFRAVDRQVGVAYVEWAWPV